MCGISIVLCLLFQGAFKPFSRPCLLSSNGYLDSMKTVSGLRGDYILVGMSPIDKETGEGIQ